MCQGYVISYFKNWDQLSRMEIHSLNLIPSPDIVLNLHAEALPGAREPNATFFSPCPTRCFGE